MSTKNGKKKPTVTESEVVVSPVPMDDKGKMSEVRMSMEELESRLKAQSMKTKSAAIRLLWNDGYSKSAIAKYLGIRYQHVRNVLTKELKRGPQTIVIEAPTPTEPETPKE